jgi:hypothetical protein
MALAWLNLVDAGREALRFVIDTGTSRFYQLKVGRSRSTREGVDWVDGVYLTTPVKPNDAGGSLLPATREIVVPGSRLEAGDSYVQLVTYKSSDGRAPAFSRVLLVSGAPELGGRLARRDPPGMPAPPMTPTLPMSVSTSMSPTSFAPSPAQFRAARKIPCVTSPDSLAVETSVEDVLSGIVKVAGPIVLKLLSPGAGGGGDAGGASPSGSAGDSSVGGVVSFLLKTLLAGLQPAAGAGGGGNAATNAANPPKETSKSLSSSMQLAENRFAAAKRTEYSRPFIFGIDDALIGALAGPILNVLPQLVNAANQQRVQTQQANNKLITDALTQVNQRMLMEQLIQAQQKSSGDQAAQLAALQTQLQALASQDQTTKTQSLSMSDDGPAAPPPSSAPIVPSATPAARATLAFVAADPLMFNGKPHLVFVRSHDAEFKVKFTVGDPVPKNPLARAILTVTLKGTHHPSGWVKAEARLTNVAANSVQTITVPQADLAKLPANRRIAVIAELRWPGSRKQAYSATGSTDIVLVDKYFVKQRGATTGDERELTDMSQYRPFWNKIWEAPPLDAVNRSGTGRAKSLWELDVNARYLVIVTGRDHANGVMETRLQASPTDPDDIRLTTSGKLKGGVELSLDEVNKLASLWDGQSPLDADHLAAFRSHAITHTSSGEFVSSIKLKGRAADRGMVWVVPVFRTAEFTLSGVQKTDDSGQVVAVTDETVRLPVAVAARVLGLLSQSGDSSDSEAGDDSTPAYKFDGYKIDVSQKIALMPITRRKHPNGTGRRKDESAPAGPAAQLQSA